MIQPTDRNLKLGLLIREFGLEPLEYPNTHASLPDQYYGLTHQKFPYASYVILVGGFADNTLVGEILATTQEYSAFMQDPDNIKRLLKGTFSFYPIPKLNLSNEGISYTRN